MGINLGNGGQDLPSMIGSFDSGAVAKALGVGRPDSGAATSQRTMNPLAAMLAGQGPQYQPGNTTWGYSGDRIMRFTPQTGLNQGPGGPGGMFGGSGAGGPGAAPPLMGGAGGGQAPYAGFQTPGMGGNTPMLTGFGGPDSPGVGQPYGGGPQFDGGQASLFNQDGGVPSALPGATRLPNGGYDLGPEGQSLVDMGTQVAPSGTPYEGFNTPQRAPEASSAKQTAGLRGLPAWSGPPLSAAMQKARQQAWDASLGKGGSVGQAALDDWARITGETFR